METPIRVPAPILRHRAPTPATSSATSESRDRRVQSRPAGASPSSSTSDPGPWLEDALAALAAQDYPSLSVLVLDNGSAEDPTAADRGRDARGPSCAGCDGERRVRRGRQRGARRRRGRDVPAASATTTSCSIPTRSGVMVEEAYRSNAGIVGPKLVDHDHPEVLLEVGMAVDHYGVPFSGIEPGEVDQEQHDARPRRLLRLARRDARARRPLPRARRLRPRRRSPAPTTSTSAGGPGSPARACSSRPTPRVRHRRATVQDTRPTSRNDQGDLRGVHDAAGCACSPSRTRRSRCSGCCRLAFLSERRRGVRARVHGPAGPGRVRCSRVGSPRSRRGSGIREAHACDAAHAPRRRRRRARPDGPRQRARPHVRSRTGCTRATASREVSNRTAGRRRYVSTRARRSTSLPAIAASRSCSSRSARARSSSIGCPRSAASSDWPGAGPLGRRSSRPGATP